uniref:Uncharacterized protein n=2 Tax=Lotharella globosa TaxID=91324 RepID=A0A7S3YBY4_9EUKA|mmetsp:Transcript_16549/g.33520  ORF Transcript_16549/g.33520 Transcript_16549/m.33520 type:complete len:227 (-) Transcript_16549:137-817(-)
MLYAVTSACQGVALYRYPECKGLKRMSMKFMGLATVVLVVYAYFGNGTVNAWVWSLAIVACIIACLVAVYMNFEDGDNPFTQNSWEVYASCESFLPAAIMVILSVLAILAGIFAAVFAEYSYDVYFSDDALALWGSIAHFFLLLVAAQMISLGTAAIADPLATGVVRMWFLWVTLGLVGPGAFVIAGRVQEVQGFAYLDVTAGFIVWVLLAYQTWVTQPEEKYGWI